MATRESRAGAMGGSLSPVSSVQVEQILRQRLQREYQPGSQFSTELALCEEFQVSRTLIRSVLGTLEEEGLIRREAGRGTFVSPQLSPVETPSLSQLFDPLQTSRSKTVVRVLSISTKNTVDTIKQRFNIEPDEPLTVICRLVSLDKVPVAYLVSYLPYEIGCRLTEKAMERRSIGWLLPKKFGIPIQKMDQTLAPIVADIDVARRLDVPIGAPVLLVERDFFRQSNKVLFHTQAYFRGHRYKYAFDMRVKRNSSKSNQKS